MADVIAIVHLMADVNAIGGWWNATEFYVVDVITTWFSLADVIAKLCDVADVITTWQMFIAIIRVGVWQML